MENEVKFYEPGSQFEKKMSAPEKKPGFGAKLANLIMRISRGRIKTEEQAYYLILAIIAVILIVSIFLLVSAFKGGGPKPLYKEDIMEL